ncbi:hypothetical protein KHC23_03525 [Ancylobacter dichloromethanicus]|uniref:Uncharacterized protein n=1 Tax=Ancylobacter dichloromethanicus TaxID=518825 RepID=A0A9W6JAK2_9HYPH|nr:hypothetical protein [Ancylobacter dichloromethanicus]MBS7552734.1 hypothetical protein [Ancylobacter dichloromethanicus]GLK72098.1 hypothetical protein GCM10017643_22140 [Ancylobacter dichloromethanicus]
MKKTVSIPMLGAVLAAAFVGPALADTNRPVIGDNSGWSPQTSQSQNYGATHQGGWSQPGYGTVYEGRNAATMYDGRYMYDGRNAGGMHGPNTQGVEPYIANQIEQNARSTN